MGLLFALTIPGLVCLLVLLVAVERLGLWARRGRLPWKRGMPLSGTGAEEMDALFNGGKRLEIETRRSESLMRDEEGDGRTVVDLDAGVVRFRG